MERTEKITDLIAALISAQKKIEGAVKDADNPFFKSKYADLESCWGAIKEPLLSNGLTVIQTIHTTQSGIEVQTMLCHTSGQYVSGSQPICAKTNDPQAIGSAITYARRYGLAAITQLVQIDDDANAAAGKEIKPKERKEETATKIKPKVVKPAEKPADSPSEKAAEVKQELPDIISDAQRTRMWSVARGAGWNPEEIKEYLKTRGYDSSKSVLKKDYESICGDLSASHAKATLEDGQRPEWDKGEFLHS